MAASITVNEVFETKSPEVVTNVIEFASKAKEVNPDIDCSRIAAITSMSIKMLANSHYKSGEFLEPSDIEQIKCSLKNYTTYSDKVQSFKLAIITDLTKFQKQIQANHEYRLEELTKQKMIHERQLKIAEFEKNKLVMDRLAKIVWPFDAKTKELDGKIATLKLHLQKLEQKLDEQKQMRPSANEKEVLLYRMYINEKYNKKAS